MKYYDTIILLLAVGASMVSAQQQQAVSPDGSGVDRNATLAGENSVPASNQNSTDPPKFRPTNPTETLNPTQTIPAEELLAVREISLLISNTATATATTSKSLSTETAAVIKPITPPSNGTQSDREDDRQADKDRGDSAEASNKSKERGAAVMDADAPRLVISPDNVLASIGSDADSNQPRRAVYAVLATIIFNLLFF